MVDMAEILATPCDTERGHPRTGAEGGAPARHRAPERFSVVLVPGVALGLFAAFLAVFVIGLSVYVPHRAEGRIHLRRPPSQVFDALITAAAIPGAELVVVPGMGHDLPRALYGDFADAIRRTADRV